MNAHPRVLLRAVGLHGTVHGVVFNVHVVPLSSGLAPNGFLACARMSCVASRSCFYVPTTVFGVCGRVHFPHRLVGSC